jgi:hypothetical protein
MMTGVLLLLEVADEEGNSMNGVVETDFLLLLRSL